MSRVSFKGLFLGLLPFFLSIGLCAQAIVTTSPGIGSDSGIRSQYYNAPDTRNNDYRTPYNNNNYNNNNNYPNRTYDPGYYDPMYNDPYVPVTPTVVPNVYPYYRSPNAGYDPFPSTREAESIYQSNLRRR